MCKDSEKIIGIVGGVGPYAGVDLNRKIFDQINAKCDQEYISTILISFSNNISDRSSFLLGKTDINPAENIANILFKLERLGATVAGIPCNTSHSPLIFNRIKEKMIEMNCTINLIHMTEEVEKFIRLYFQDIKKIGLLSTLGTYKSKIYQKTFENSSAEIIMPDENDQKELIHDAIYNAEYGIKTKGYQVNNISQQKLYKSICHLKKKNVDAIIMGCTEIPIAITEKKIGETIMIDPTLILARALIREVDDKHLKPYER